MQDSFIGLIVGFVVCWVLLIFCVRQSHRQRLRDQELNAPLLAEGAEDGYKECKLCGFENFKRFLFCNICGEQLAAAADENENSAVVSTRESRCSRAHEEEDDASTPEKTRSPREQLAVTRRQKRARKRKEWVRKLGVDGKLFWYRDGNGGVDFRFAGCTLQYKGEQAIAKDQERFSDTNTTSSTDASSISVVVIASAPEGVQPTSTAALELNGEPDSPRMQQLGDEESASDRFMRVGKDNCMQSLNEAVSALQIKLVPASTATPRRLPLASASETALQWRDILSLASQVFPKKYAHFVTTTAGLIVSSESIKISVNRDNLLNDSMDSLSVLPVKNIRTSMRIHFFNEAGIDAGGLHREWFVLVNEQLVDPKSGMFYCVNTDEQTYFFNGNSLHDVGEHHLMYYYATGRLIGRALLEGYVLGFHLALPLIKAILGLPVTFSDLEYFDPEAYKSLLWLIENDGVESLGLDFSITEKRGDAMVSVDLIPNGRSIDVTDDNKEEYLERRFRYMVFESVSSQLYVFLKGIYEVIPQELLMLFDPEEFDYLLCGSDEIDVDDWERNTRYTAGLRRHQALIWFWELVREMPNEYRRRLLHFATGSSRVPIAGFSSLTSYDGRLCPFTLKGVRLVKDGYIRSHACFNQLDLPLHVDREQLKAVLNATVETEITVTACRPDARCGISEQPSFRFLLLTPLDHECAHRETSTHCHTFLSQTTENSGRKCARRSRETRAMAQDDELQFVIFLGFFIGFMVCCLCVRGAHKKRQFDIELRAVLLPTEAEEGFNRCTLCGFENFKRFPFCNVCGEQIAAFLESESAESKKRKRSMFKKSKEDESEERDVAPRRVGVTLRQQRVRKRKEWSRRLGVDGKLFWYRDGSNGADVRFPGHAVLFHGVEARVDADKEARVEPGTTRRSSCEGDIAVLADAEREVHSNGVHIDESETPRTETHSATTFLQPTKEECMEALQRVVSAARMEVVESSAADPALLPVVMASDRGMQWRDTLGLATQSFPAKYAHFVTTTTGLLTQSNRELIKLNLRRETLFKDSMESLCILPATSIRSGMRINFVEEAGIDAGGLHREWFVLLNERLATPTCGVFRCVNIDEQTFFLNSNSRHDLGETHLMYYSAAGRLIGRALLEGYVMGLHLSFPLIKIILGLPVTFADLEYFDPEAYRGLLWLVDNDGAEELGLDFSVTEKRGDDLVAVELVPNGRNIEVTDDNKDEYLERRFRYTLFESVSSQLCVFLKGIYEVIPQELLMLFDPEEFDYLLCGSDEIDVDDWERNTKYSSDLKDHPALIWFWELVREMPNEYRRRLLHFATGSSRVPIAGFSSLTSYDGRLCPFTLKGVKLVDDGYIWSHACFNRLDLPLHVVHHELKAVLYAAIETEMYGFTTS